MVDMPPPVAAFPNNVRIVRVHIVTSMRKKREHFIARIGIRLAAGWPLSTLYLSRGESEIDKGVAQAPLEELRFSLASS
jgi:hypothetical protein